MYVYIYIYYLLRPCNYTHARMQRPCLRHRQWPRKRRWQDTKANLKTLGYFGVGVLGGSWVVISGVKSPLEWMIIKYSYPPCNPTYT